MATTNNRVNFVYVPTGKDLPATKDADSIYFVESAQQLYVGSKLIADATDLTPYKVKDVTVSGTGDHIASAELSAEGMLTLTKGTLPTLSKGTDTTGTAKTLTPGGTFTAMTDTAVSGHTITDENTTFTMPHQMSAVAVEAGTAAGSIKLKMTTTDTAATPTYSADYQVFTPSDYMLATNGTATGASITLAADPTAAMQAATKQYVDEAVSGLSGAMHFIGVSTTAITDGGTEKPTIGGVQVTPKTGDVCIYDNLEYLWNVNVWKQLGSVSSYALKTRKVDAGEGLTGGGDLTADRTISHSVTGPTTGAGTATADTTALTVFSSVTYDKFGHVSAFGTASIATEVEAKVTAGIQTLDVAAPTSGDYVQTISQTDGKISPTMGTKGTIASGQTGLVDGGTVYTAIEAAKAVWTVIS